MLIHNFNPVAIYLFELEIRWYSLAYIFGIIFGWAYAKNIIKKTAKINTDEHLSLTKNLDDLIPYLIIGMILGGRIGYVLFYNLDYYKNNLLEIFYLWNGGMSFHGGLIGIFISIFFFSKKNKISYFYFMDIISLVSPIGIFFGRLANFINAELVGKKLIYHGALFFHSMTNF
jgi:phosphatidylglycerol---prolipoprotein diacylglyceryl transferase